MVFNVAKKIVHFKGKVVHGRLEGGGGTTPNSSITQASTQRKAIIKPKMPLYVEEHFKNLVLYPLPPIGEPIFAREKRFCSAGEGDVTGVPPPPSGNGPKPENRSKNFSLLSDTKIGK